jgi:hypothetical protein
MPILTEANQPKGGRAPWLALLAAFAVLLPAGLFAWSLARPVTMRLGNHELSALRSTDPLYGDIGPYIGSWDGSPGWSAIVPLPGGKDVGWYVISWTAVILMD